MAYTTPHADLVCPADSVEQLKKEQAWARELAEKDAASARPTGGKGRKAIDTDKRIMFAAMMMRLDRDVGRIMAKLKERGIDGDTLVVFTSDNGPHAEGGKDNPFFNSSGGLRGIKRDMYEGGIHEPFAIRWPGRIKAGSTSDHLAAFWDFAPTVLEIIGEPAPSGIDGISYAPTILGRPDDQKKHDYLYWELLVKDKGCQAVRQGDWKAIRNGLNNKIELYDLSNDAAEKNDLAAGNPGKVAHFEKLLASARTHSSVFPLELPKGKKGATDPFDP
jgi:arylsulfatase A-like enzyme